jgi:hypothetical protein
MDRASLSVMATPSCEESVEYDITASTVRFDR